MKSWKRSKTLIFNALVLALAAAESQLHMIQPLLPVNFYAVIAFALPVINAGLRVITSQALAIGVKP